jgi:hypothetical protein
MKLSLQRWAQMTISLGDGGDRGRDDADADDDDDDDDAS